MAPGRNRTARAGRAIGAGLGALAILAMTLFMPLHAVSHIGEASAAHVGLSSAPAIVPGDPDGPHGAPCCDICLACLNGAFVADPGDGGPQLAAPPAAAHLRIGAEAAEVEFRVARRERPEPRGPPPALV